MTNRIVCWISVLLLSSILSIVGFGCANKSKRAYPPPPPAKKHLEPGPVEIPTGPSGVKWIPGHWEWDGTEWIWIQGRFE